MTQEITPEQLRKYDSENLNLLGQRVAAEQRRRRAQRDNEQQMDRLLAEHQRAEGTAGKDGDPWEQPQGAWDAYPKGAVRTHIDKTWQSTVAMNVWEPGVSGWREIIPPNPETGEPGVPEYQQPTGAHDAYQTGEQMRWEDGEIYESVMDGNVWSPADYPQGWKRIED